MGSLSSWTRAGRLGLGLILILGLAGAREARAVTSMQIDEVMPGAFLRPDVQFVELLTSSCFGLDWAGKVRLVSYDAAGTLAGEFVFPSEPPFPYCSTRNSVLVGTQAFADLPGTPEPDFVMPPILVPGGGKVCFRNVPGAEQINLCLTYGPFTGDTEQGSPDNAPAVSGAGICALQRDVLFGYTSFTQSYNEDFRLLPPAPTNTAGETGTVAFPPRFADVPAGSPFFPFVEALALAGVTGGCGAGGVDAYCPQEPVTREQMAVFLLLATEGPSYQPPACVAPVFSDVPCASPFAPWINELAARGITGGCGGGGIGAYCPQAAVTREQMAVFLLLAMEGPSYQPPACATALFSDVPCSHPFAPWINELAARGITGGCGGGAFCPSATVTREQMAVFLSLAADLPVPSLGCPPLPDLDDHGDGPATATLLPLPADFDAVLERRGDDDFFAFDLQAGGQVSISASPLQSGASTVHSLVTVFDADGLTVLADEIVFPDSPVLFGFTAPQPGRYFLSFRTLSRADRGTYHLAVDGPFLDDHADTREGATPIVVGGGVLGGRFEIPGDADVFSFPAAAGQVWVVTAEPVTAGLRPTLSLLGPAGYSLSSSETASFQWGDAGLAFLRPFTSGVYFAEARAIGLGATVTGDYNLQVEGPLADDHGNTPGTATPLLAGAPAEGLTVLADADFFSFAAAAGQRYVVEVEALSGAARAQLLGLNGMTVLRQGDADEISAAWLTLEPGAAGTYFVRVASSSAGAYRVRLRGPVADDHGGTPATATPLTLGVEAGGVLETVEDVDVFVLSGVTEGDVYTVTFAALSPGLTASLRAYGADPAVLAANNLVQNQTLDLRVPASGDLYLELKVPAFQGSGGGYSLRIDGPAVDDHGNGPPTATLLTPGAPAVDGAIDDVLDIDAFAFDALAGHTYTLKAVLLGITSQQLRMEARGPDGITVLIPDRADDLLALTAPAAGRYFLLLRGTGFGFPQPYRVAVGPPVLDDHGGGAATATPLTVDGPAVAGGTQFEGDFDWFSFPGTAGEALVVEVAGATAGDDVILDLFGPDGTTLLATDDDGGGGPGAVIAHTPTATATLFARVRSRVPGGTEAYEISVRREP